MYGRKVKLRFFFILLISITLSLTIFLILKSLEENVVFFQSPSEIKGLSELNKKKIRVGGMVKNKSISIQAEDGIRDLVRSRGLGDVYKRQSLARSQGMNKEILSNTSSI